MLKTGDKIPTDIPLKDMQGNDVTLDKFLGQFIVLYFYPKDGSPGCTIEACEFRDFNKDIKKLGAEVIGISKDSIDSHTSFKDKHGLNFTLLSDQTHELEKAFGVWNERTLFNNDYAKTKRTTFLINPEGKIIYIWENVKPLGHAQEVYDFLQRYFA